MILWKITGSFGNHFNIVKVKILELNNELLTTTQALIARVRRVEYTRDR